MADDNCISIYCFDVIWRYCSNWTKKFKKTTITGQAAGIAKRLESQAKKIRSNLKSKSFPIILMNSNLYKSAKTLSAIDKNKPFIGVNVPLHVGAIKYYREVGIKIPKRLIPPEAK